MAQEGVRLSEVRWREDLQFRYAGTKAIQKVLERSAAGLEFTCEVQA